MKIIYPTNCNTAAQRTAVLYRLQELLRLEHNIHGAKFRSNQLSWEAWCNYLNKEFNPKSIAIINEILKYRFILKNDVEQMVTTKENIKDEL